MAFVGLIHDVLQEQLLTADRSKFYDIAIVITTFDIFATEITYSFFLSEGNPPLVERQN